MKEELAKLVAAHGIGTVMSVLSDVSSDIADTCTTGSIDQKFYYKLAGRILNSKHEVAAWFTAQLTKEN